MYYLCSRKYFYSNEDEDSKEENTTATLCEAAHSRYRSVNE